jgi:hypothetical protein
MKKLMTLLVAAVAVTGIGSIATPTTADASGWCAPRGYRVVSYRPAACCPAAYRTVRYYRPILKKAVKKVTYYRVVGYRAVKAKRYYRSACCG